MKVEKNQLDIGWLMKLEISSYPVYILGIDCNPRTGNPVLKQPGLVMEAWVPLQFGLEGSDWSSFHEDFGM